MKNKLKNFIILAILLFLYTFICAQNYVSAVSNNLSQAVFRLHVLANSNSEEDQNLKYKVRDGLIKYMNNICSNCSTKAEAISIANEHKNDFQEIAQNIVKGNGYDYPVKINIGNFYFPTKNYGDISLPAGPYDALKVEIGEAKGQNWWCVLYPPMCIPAAQPTQELNDVLNESEMEIVTSEPKYEIRFACVELFERLKEALEK